MSQINTNNLQLVEQSLASLPEQISQLLTQTKSFKLPKNYKNINKIVISGMGGSNLGGRIIASVFEADLQLPILLAPSYEVPGYIDKHTLYICSSYSGLTEETISAYNEAKKKKAKLVVVGSDQSNNILANKAKRDQVPTLLFTVEANPANQPRLALGYAIFALAIVLEKAQALKLTTKQILTANEKMKNWGQKLVPEKSNNTASKLAHKLYNKNIVIITGEFLEGNAHTLRNQFCENSKNFADYLVLPELNHYALEGLANPQANNLIFLCFDSALYSPRVQKRAELTKKIIQKNKLDYISYKLQGKNKLEQSLEMLQLGVWTTFYLAGLNKVDPIKIPWVDWFKQQLK